MEKRKSGPGLEEAKAGCRVHQISLIEDMKLEQRLKGEEVLVRSVYDGTEQKTPGRMCVECSWNSKEASVSGWG